MPAKLLMTGLQMSEEKKSYSKERFFVYVDVKSVSETADK